MVRPRFQRLLLYMSTNKVIVAPVVGIKDVQNVSTEVGGQNVRVSCVKFVRDGLADEFRMFS